MRLGRLSGYGSRVFSWKRAAKVYRVFHATPGGGTPLPYRSTPGIGGFGNFTKMNAATNLSRAVQAGVLSRIARGRYQAVKGAFSAGHKFWGNQYVKLASRGSQASRQSLANKARLNLSLLSWAKKNQTLTRVSNGNTKWVNKPVSISTFLRRGKFTRTAKSQLIRRYGPKWGESVSGSR